MCLMNTEKAVNQIMEAQGNVKADTEALEQCGIHNYSPGHILRGSPRPFTKTSTPNRISTTVKPATSFFRKSCLGKELRTTRIAIAKTTPKGFRVYPKITTASMTKTIGFGPNAPIKKNHR